MSQITPPCCIVRGRHVITHTIDRHHWNQIDDGAVLVDNGFVKAVGTFVELAAAYPDAPVFGDGSQVVLPGFINAHHHVGLTPVQLGAPDLPLELWFAARLVCRAVDPYLDTLYSAFEMIASGCTTVQHIHTWVPGDLEAVNDAANQVLRAYRDIGMRVSYSYTVRDQNRLVYGDDATFVASLPSDLQPAVNRHLARFQLSLEDHFTLFDHLRTAYAADPKVAVQLAPANLHWCSDAALERTVDAARQNRVPIHMHLVETPYQREYARRRSGGRTALEYIDQFGLVSSDMTIGHGVWLSDTDLERIADAGAHLCHNCSSNFRLRSGLAPLNTWQDRGINAAIGIDEAGINDDRDMLQEMRLVRNVHRAPGMDDKPPEMAQILRMATTGGAATTGFKGRIGSLQPGQEADLILLDWEKITEPYLDLATPVLDAVIHRGKAEAVDMTMCRSEVIYENACFTKIEKDGVFNDIRNLLAQPLNDAEKERKILSVKLISKYNNYYNNYINNEASLFRPGGT